VKTILLAILLLGSAASGFSQTQETKLLDRIQKPNMELGNPMQNKSFKENSVVPLKTSSQAQGSYYDIKDANTKSFPSLKSFFGLKNPWFGRKIYETKQTGEISEYHDIKQDRLAGKTTEVEDYDKSKKEANLGSSVVPLPVFVPQPAAGGAVSRMSDKINDKMTIDEVRELLNKPR